MSVQSEVTRALTRPEDFVDVDLADRYARIKNDDRHRDRPDNVKPAHVVVDGNYVSARRRGDAHTFAQRFALILQRTRHVASENRTTPSPPAADLSQ